jgi:integrase
MNAISPKTGFDSRDAFRGDHFATLADVRKNVADLPQSSWRRDTLSALKIFSERFRTPLSEVTATLTVVQRLFASKVHGELGLSKKRYENIRASILQAVRRNLGGTTTRISLPLSEPWKLLLDRIPEPLQRHGLRRFAHFCSVTGVLPDQISAAVLQGYREAIEAEGALSSPYRALINAITHWNWCAKNVLSWPRPARLSVPNPKIFFMKRWSEFPASFHADFQKLIEKLANPDVFNYETGHRALRPATLRNHDVIVRNYASALIATGVPISKIRRIADLVPSFKVYETTLRHLYARTGKAEPTEYLAKHAQTIFNIARYHCKMSKTQLEQMRALCRHLTKPTDRTLAQSNREKLRQFDNDENVDKLLAYPAEEYKRSKKAKTGPRRAKCVERALSVSILISTCLRLFNLRTLRLADFRWHSDGCYLEIPKERVKNRQQLNFFIPEFTAKVLREYIDEHRPLLAAKDNEYLFAGQSMKPRHQNSLREEIENSIRKHTGLVMNPHLFRSAMAKIILKENPALAMHISRVLGHFSPDMTFQKYLGTEGPEASRLLDRAVQARRDATPKGRKR